MKTNVIKCRTGGLGVEEDDEAVLSVWCMWMRESRLGLMCIVWVVLEGRLFWGREGEN